MLDKKLVSLVSSIYIEEIKKNVRKLGYEPFNSEIGTSGETLTIDIPEKYKFIETGRVAFTKKIPTDALIKFLKRNGVSNNLNSTAFKIQNYIYKKGIKAKKDFISKLYGNSEEMAAIEIEIYFENEIKKFFNKKQ